MIARRGEKWDGVRTVFSVRFGHSQHRRLAPPLYRIAQAFSVRMRLHASGQVVLHGRSEDRRRALKAILQAMEKRNE